MKKIILLFLIFISFLSSCSSYKEVSYFQDLKDNTQGQFTNEETPLSLVVCPDDELSIIVSAIEPITAIPYNLPLVAAQQAKSRANEDGKASNRQQTAAQTVQTYLVDSKGEINFPGIGKMKVTGMTIDELTEYLTELLRDKINEPIVNVQIVNFSISVLGEVNLPGIHRFYKQRVSVLEAIASAQDMTIHGQRDNVMIARDVNGKKEYFKLDLTTSEVFKSPNLYLQQNDIVYVMPNKEKQRDASSGEQKQFNMSIIVSAISTVVSIIAIVTR